MYNVKLVIFKFNFGQVMAWCRQATSHYISANVDPDLCHHMTPLGNSELMLVVQVSEAHVEEYVKCLYY